MIDYNQYKVPEIKAELKKRGLSQTGKKADLVARIQGAIENESFALFPKLPVEVRHRIWVFALPPRRMVDIWTGPLGNSMSADAPRLTAVINIMLTSKEAFRVASKRYRPTPAPTWCQAPSTDDRFPPCKVNYFDDVFHLADFPGTIITVAHFKYYLDIDLIESVAFSIQDLQHCLNMLDLQSLLQLKALREIILIEDFRPPPKQKNRPQSFATALINMMAPPRLEVPSFLDSYGEGPTAALSAMILADVENTIEVNPELKPLENVKIYFSQLR